MGILRKKRNSFVFIILCFFIFSSCGKYKDISSENGRQAIIDEANNYLTAGMCTEALTTLKPLYDSQYVNNDIRLLYASAYACKGGLNFPSLITAIKNAGSDIWTPIISSNYSTSSSDGKTTNLQQAASIVRATAGTYNAVNRTPDANVYMVFVQLEVIGTTIARTTVGNADAAGKKGTTITGKGTNQEKCDIEVAFATIMDSLNNVSAGSAISKAATSLQSICTTVGSCPTNLDPQVCTVTEQNQGAALLAAIDTQWQ